MLSWLWEKMPWFIVLMHVPLYNSKEAHYREDGASGRQTKGIGRDLDDGSAKGAVGGLHR